MFGSLVLVGLLLLNGSHPKFGFLLKNGSLYYGGLLRIIGSLPAYGFVI
jgi:hypothetical protein